MNVATLRFINESLCVKYLSTSLVLCIKPTSMTQPTKRNLLKVIGPGLLFASSAIGTSHLVLSTRAGAHHGMIFLWIILLALLLKYPFIS